MDQLVVFWNWMHSYHMDMAYLMNHDELKHIFPWTAVTLYVLMLWIVPKIVTKQVKFVEKIMPIWNLGLSILSVCMLIGIGYPVYQYTMELGFFKVLCGWTVIETPSMAIFWIYVFALSKYAELFDTLWVLLKNPGRPVEFLHTWHHITVLLFTWYAEMWRFGVGYWFAIMNSLIHTFMYWYYFQMSIGGKPSWARLLTVGQISQMIIGTGLNAYWVYLYFNDITCACGNPKLLLIACAVMYGSYLYLFCDFFVRKYIMGTSKPAAKKDERKKE